MTSGTRMACDTRALQHYLGHKNIQHTVRNTAMAGSKIFGGTDDEGADDSRTSTSTGAKPRSPFRSAFLIWLSSPLGAEQPKSSRSKKTTRHIFSSRARWRSDLAWHALPRADRGVGLQHHSVLGFGRIEQRAAYRPLDHFCRRSSLRFKRGLDVLDHGLKLLVRQALDHIALLDLVLARDKQGETSQVHPRLVAAHLCDGFFSVLTEIA